MNKKIGHDIIEDIVFLNETENSDNEIVYECAADKQEFYKTLIKETDNSLWNKVTKIIADEYLKYQQIYYWLYQNGYLQKYSYSSGHYSEGYVFKINLDTLLEKTKVEQELRSNFSKEYKEYIDNFCNPKEVFRCSTCGAISFTSQAEQILEEDEEYNCAACSTLDEYSRERVKDLYYQYGTLRALANRDNCLETFFGCTTSNEKLRRIVCDNFQYAIGKNGTINEIVKVANNILERNNLDNLVAFESVYNDLIIWNKGLLIREEEIYQKVIEFGEVEVEIHDFENIVWTSYNVIKFLREFELTKKEKDILSKYIDVNSLEKNQNCDWSDLS